MTVKRTPIVAIVGRTNVGKSSLYNLIIKRREAIIAREAGTTRDSLMSKAHWHNQEFWLVDTAGVKDPEDEFEFTIQEQIYQAKETADLIILMVDASVPMSDDDRKLSELALKSNKPAFLVINKIDKVKDLDKIDHYKNVGIKEHFLISVSQRRGIDKLLTKIVSAIPKITAKKENQNSLTISLIGRPNVGKSTLFNALLKKQQAIVSDRAGTTRDVNRKRIKYHSKEFQILDTAGIRRPGKIQQGVEKFSVIRSLGAIEESDVCLLLMDCNELNVALDQKLAGTIKEANKGLILVIAKWDSMKDKDPFLRDKIAQELKNTFDFVPWAPLILTSAITGQNVTKIFDLALEIIENRQAKIKTTKLNNWLMEAINQTPPAGLKNRFPKLNYMVQETDNEAPSFKIFGSNTKYLHWSYKRYLEKNFRQNYNFDGTPIQLWFIEKHTPHKHGSSPTKAKK